MSRYVAGRRKEYDMRDRLLRSGAQLVIRAAGSKGLADLIAIYRHAIALVQMKCVQRGRGRRS